MASEYAIGVDFGGTKVLASVVNLDTGKILGSAKKRTDQQDTPKQLGERLFSTIDDAIKSADLPKKKSICGIGVGIAGQVDSKQGILLGAPNLSQATVNMPLVEMLTERYDVPAALLNDVQIAAIGESAFGAGKEVDDFLCVFVGTGVGGAFVHRGELVRGASGSAGEIGHLVIDANGRVCGCGGRGHLEAYASRTAITNVIIGDLKRGRSSILTKLAPDLMEDAAGGAALRSGVLAKALEEEDELATEAIRDAAFYLSLGLASAINLLNPSRIILGGGVIESVPLLFELASRRASQEALATPGNVVEIVRAELGDNAGVVGAAIIGSKGT